MGDQPDRDDILTVYPWGSTREYYDKDADTWITEYQFLPRRGGPIIPRGAGPNLCVVPDSPAWYDGRGRFTSRLPHGNTLITGVRHYAGTLDDFDDSFEDDALTKLDGAHCIIRACLDAPDYMADAFIEMVGHPILELLKGLIPGLLMTIAGVGVVTFAGWAIGGALGLTTTGGAFSPLGAGIGAKFAFELSMFVITWIGFGFLTSMLASSIIEAGDLMQRGILSAWNARGMEGHGRELMIDIGAHDIARGIAVVFRAILEGIVLYVIGKDAVRFTRGLALSAETLSVYVQTLVKEGGRLDWVLGQMRMTRSLAELADWIQGHFYELLRDKRTNPLLRPDETGGAGAAADAPPLPKEEPPPAQKKSSAPAEEPTQPKEEPAKTPVKAGEKPTRLPVSDGEWAGTPGNSGWKSTKPEVNAVTKGEAVPYEGGFPKYDQWVEPNGNVKIDMKGNYTSDFAAADKTFAQRMGWLKSNGEPNASAAAKYRQQNGLTWHHHQDLTTMQLVPRVLNDIPHTGGASILRGGK